jgi:O-Antigen ligase
MRADADDARAEPSLYQIASIPEPRGDVRPPRAGPISDGLIGFSEGSSFVRTRSRHNTEIAEAGQITGERERTAVGTRLPVSAAAAVTAALAFAGIGVCIMWAWHDGGYAPEEWLPGGLLLLALLCTATASAAVRERLQVAPLPLVLFGLYVAWSYLSILWAQVPGDALDGANRTLVYWLAFTLFYGLGLGQRLGTAVVFIWGVALAALGLVAVAQAASAATPAGHFVLGRLAAPIAYPDGDAALFLSACLTLLVLASRRQQHAALRLPAAAAAVVLGDLSVLCQSRGSLVALPCALVLYFVVARDRLRAFAHLVIAAVAVVPALPALLHVYSAVVAGAGRSGAVTHALAWIAVSAGLAMAGMGILLLFERRVSVSDTSRVLIGRSLLAAGAAAVLFAVVVAAGSHPMGRAQRAWHNFTTNSAAPVPKTPHFTSGFGTSRYDVWRVAIKQFIAHPLNGVGSDNFLVGYLQQRRTSESSRYPQSVELRAFSETGVVGAAFFLGFLTLAFVRATHAARRSRSPGLALACFVGFGYWLFHASIDWFWELPALAGSALILLAIAAAPTPAEVSRPASRASLPWLKVGAAAAAALVIAAALAIPWASVSLIDAAVVDGAGRSAYSMLKTAARLNPLSEQPALAEATLSANAGSRARERRALLQASRRSPYDWYPYFMLGIVAGRTHQRALARADLARAHRLSPHSGLIIYAQNRLHWGNPLTERQVAQIFRELSSTLRGVQQG